MIRYIPLNAVALAAFERLFKTSKSEGPVFIAEDGDSLKGYKHWFEDAVAEAGLKDFTWYCLRHTFASRLVMAGVDIRTVAELMGHKTIQMTMRYAHLAPEHQLAAVQRLCAAPAADHEQEQQTQEAKGTAITPWGQTATTTATSTVAALNLSTCRSTISPVFVTSSTQRGPVAQRLEQWTHNPLVAGSNPAGPTNLFNHSPVSNLGYAAECTFGNANAASALSFSLSHPFTPTQLQMLILRRGLHVTVPNDRPAIPKSFQHHGSVIVPPREWSFASSPGLVNACNQSFAVDRAAN